MATILILNGPNLNLLGVREPEIYGSTTLAQIEERCRAVAHENELEVRCRQSNHEGQLIDWLHEARTTANAVIINPAAHSFSSTAIFDALKAIALPVVEVHISNIHRREQLYHKSLMSAAAVGVICGLGPYGYEAAIRFLAGHLAAGKVGKT